MKGLGARFALIAFISTVLLSACNSTLTSEKPNDQAITSEIQAKLFADSVLKTRDIRVTSTNGVVMLTGTVNTDLEKAAVENMARQLKGVSNVLNELTVASEAASAAVATPVEAANAQPASVPAARRRAARPREAAPSAAPASQPAAQGDSAAPTAAAPAQPSQTAMLPPAAAPQARQPEHITIPAGTTITVRMTDGIDSAQNRPGEEFAATVDAPIVVDDRVVIRRGADARVRLRQSASAGRMTGRSQLEVELVGLNVGGQIYGVETSVVDKAGASRGKRTAATVGGGAALGGLIGAIAGRGKGAAIGAAVGAGAGTAVQAATKGEQVKIPPETKLDFTFKAPLTVTM